MKNSDPTVLAFATKGTGSNDELRLCGLLEKTSAILLPFTKSGKIHSFVTLLRLLSKHRRKLIVMEGTGITGGMACLVGRILWGHRYVVSSGDAVGPFIGTHHYWLGPLFALYERVLCRFASGYIGWTPYLVGRALTFGTPRAMTVAGWSLGIESLAENDDRAQIRKKWGVGQDQIVFGIAGALVWNRRREYCYGMELVKAVCASHRNDVVAVIVGEGSGLPHLRKQAGSLLGTRVFLPGQVPLDEVVPNLRAMDVGCLPQSTDAVGAFRFTTKLSEYLSVRLPIVTSQVPAAYDLELGTCWRLPGLAPWDTVFIDSLTNLMNSVTYDDIRRHRAQETITSNSTFDRESQVERVTSFLNDIVAEICPQTVSKIQPDFANAGEYTHN